MHAEAFFPFIKSLGGGLSLQHFTFLHERIDQIGLTALSQLFFHKLRDVRLLGGHAHRGDDLAATSWLFIDQGDIQIPIDGHRQGPRNGGGSHHQHIRNDALTNQRSSLTHAEFVLLINHHQTQVPKAH